MKEQIKEVLDKYVADMRAAPKQDIPEIREHFARWYTALPTEDQAHMQPFWEDIKKTVKVSIDEIGTYLTELKSLREVKLIVENHEYSLNEWITISDYSRRHNLKTSRVQNWITRGIIPSDKVVVVPQLNSLKLIKDEIYKSA